MYKYIILQHICMCHGHKNGSPPKVHSLICRTCGYVTLCGKRDFAVVTKLRILKWGDYLVGPNLMDPLKAGEKRFFVVAVLLFFVFYHT